MVGVEGREPEPNLGPRMPGVDGLEPDASSMLNFKPVDILLLRSGDCESDAP